jgi:hypothetical protein
MASIYCDDPQTIGQVKKFVLAQGLNAARWAEASRFREQKVELPLGDFLSIARNRQQEETVKEFR